MFLSLLKKDFYNLLRSPQHYLAVGFFSLILVILASIAFRQIGFGEVELRRLTPGILWLIFLFAGIQCLHYAFVHETEFDALTGLLLTSVDSSLVYVSKMLTTTVFLLCVQILVIIAHALFSALSLESSISQLVLVSFLATVGFVSLGTLLAGMAAGVRGREILLPLILFPILVPLLAAAVFTTGEVLELGTLDYRGFWFQLMIGYDVLAFTLSFVLFEFVARE